MVPDERLRIALRALARSHAADTEVTVTSSRLGLTRFTHEAVSQNIDQSDTSIRVRAIVDGRIGIAATNAFDDAALDGVVERAQAIARLAPREQIEPVFAAASTAPAPAGAYVEHTATAMPDARARIAGAIFGHAARNGLWSSGYVTTARTGVTIATSNGARMTFDGTDAGANVKMNGTDSTGFAERYSTDIADIDGAALGAQAARIARLTREPIAVDPGDWTVILAPAAAGELLRYVSLQLGAEAYSDGSSFIAGRLTDSVLGANVTIDDDCAHPLNPAMPFDFEAFPTRRVRLVDGGVANDVVTDSRWAVRLGRPNTGHALAAPNSSGPIPQHIVVAPGPTPLATLVAGTARGLLVTRLWYVRVVDMRTLLLTGMTRDGTFLIEDGVVRGGVRNMRFNQSMVAALSDCEIADTPVRTGSYHYSLVTPAIKINHFGFASASPY